MGYRHVLLALLVAVVGGVGGCGKEIGDACTLSSDCSPNGDRICQCSECSGPDPTSDSAQGYCTIQGCDYSTCPDEAVCVRFFTGGFDNPPNTTCLSTQDQPATVTCTPDELCSLAGQCVPRSSEIRYCMRTCDSSGDCRDGYECRNLTLMMEHGGEPVLMPGKPIDDSAPKFCAAKPTQ